MNTCKKFCVIVLILIPAISFAQKVTVNKDTEASGNSVDGYSIELTGTVEEVMASYTKYLKTFGKVKSSGNTQQVLEATVNSNACSAPLYAKTLSKGEKTSVALGLKASEWSTPALAEQVAKDLEKVLYDFGVKFYRDKVQVDIDESVRAQQAAEKQPLRLQNESKNLVSRLDFNTREKIRLEKLLAENKLEYESLVSSIAKNKKDQDSVLVATDQIKKMVEIHKERQRKVN
jgi:hypothetical protein